MTLYLSEFFRGFQSNQVTDKTADRKKIPFGLDNINSFFPLMVISYLSLEEHYELFL